MTAPVEEAVAAPTPTPADPIRVRPQGVRARVKASAPSARARVSHGAVVLVEERHEISARGEDVKPSSSLVDCRTEAATESPTGLAESESEPEPGSDTVLDADALEAAAPPRPTAKFTRALRAHFGSIAGTVILAVVVWRLGTGVFLDGLRRIDGGTLVAAVAIGVLTTVFSAWRWCAVTRALGLSLPLGPAVADYYRALFLNAALPGGVLGDVHRAVRHGQSSGDVGRGVRAVVIERTAGQLVLAVVGVTVLLTLPSPVLDQTRQAAGVLALAVLGAVAIWAAVRMGRAPGQRGGRGRRLRVLLADSRDALLSRRSGPAVVMSSVVVLAGYVAMFLLSTRVAGSAATWLEVLPLALLALIAMSLPLNVGGWGPREGVTAWSFGAAGLGASQGLTVAVVYGVLSFVASLPGVLVLVGRWYGSLRARRQSSEVTTERYAPKESTNPASSSFPFAAEASDGRPMTPESV